MCVLLPSLASSRQTDIVLSSRPTSCSTAPSFRLNSLSVQGHSYDSSVCHIQRQTNRQQHSLSPGSESQFGAGCFVQIWAICAVCNPPALALCLITDTYCRADQYDADWQRKAHFCVGFGHFKVMKLAFLCG